MSVSMSYLGPTIYTGNSVSKELVWQTKCALQEHDYVCICFDVIGRTKHVCLARELLEDLGDEYEAQIEYDSYLCKITKKEVK